MDNAKMFSQLMSKSRSLAKISKREAAFIICLRNYRLKAELEIDNEKVKNNSIS